MKGCHGLYDASRNIMRPGGIRDMGGPKKDMAVSKPPRWYGWSKSGFPNTTYTLKFAINLRNENLAYPKIYRKFGGIRGIREPAPDPPIPPGGYLFAMAF